MINPVRSEEDAFRFTLIVAALVVPIVLAAVIFGSGVAAGVGLGLLIGCVAGALLFRNRGEPRPKMLLGRRIADRQRGGRRRILVVANETVAGSALRREVEYRSRGYDAEIRVICPALDPKLRGLTADEVDARAAAQQRLNELVSDLLGEGLRAAGKVGGTDPLRALEEGLRTFAADEVIISTRPHGRSHWLEGDLVGKAREQFTLPITHVIVDLEQDGAMA